ncbi:MAG: hypothetical protein BGO76_07510 [Caedibacter sp. 38-128]|nr:hypothetical protein [Holosporales bacterium]OJX04852.1 MAG: hypothetical protein BGO76_07510 [Caedibacter sp. 38-128]
MLRKTIHQLSVLLVTIGGMHLNGYAHVQQGKEKGDFIVTAQELRLNPLDQGQQYTCQITDPSILFKPKNKGETKNLTSNQFCSLWKKGHSFKVSAPNATLIFSDQQGNSYQMIFEIPKADSTSNTLTLTAAPLTSQGNKGFLKNSQPVSEKEFMDGAQTAKKETLSLLIDDADEPDYNNPWDPS